MVRTAQAQRRKHFSVSASFIESDIDAAAIHVERRTESCPNVATPADYRHRVAVLTHVGSYCERVNG
jgi:hypothetical protein